MHLPHPRNVRTTTGRATLAISGFAVAGALLLPGIASAAPAPLDNPLVESTCSFAQVDAALHARSPEIAGQLDSAPDQKAMLQRMYDQPVEQRRAAFAQLLNNSPQMQDPAQQQRVEQVQAALADVAGTCHNY